MMFKTPFVLFFALVASVCAYSDEIFALMQRDSYLANAPYCLEKFLLTDLFHNGRYYLEKQGLQVVQIFRPDFGRNTQISAYSFLGINDTSKEIVISFRGSLTLNDWIVDFTFLPQSYKPLSGVGECTGDCKVHLGVYEQFKLTYKDIITTFNGIKATHPDYSVTVTGHSLGAGYAYLMGVELQLLGHQPTLITYGGLRMGNAAMNDWVDSIFKSKEVADRINAGETPLNSYIRVVQAYDIVPLVPPGPLYNHAGVSFTIRDNSTLFPSKDDVVFDGYKPKLNEIIADILLSGRILDLLRALDHNKFFRRMAIPCLSDTVSISGR